MTNPLPAPPCLKGEAMRTQSVMLSFCTPVVMIVGRKTSPEDYGIVQYNGRAVSLLLLLLLKSRFSGIQINLPASRLEDTHIVPPSWRKSAHTRRIYGIRSTWCDSLLYHHTNAPSRLLSLLVLLPHSAKKEWTGSRKDNWEQSKFIS